MDRHVSRDVTEERSAREALKTKSEQAERQRAKIESLYRTAPIGLALFDAQDFRYLRLNNRQAEFFGLEPNQIVGRTLTEMAPIDGLRELFESVGR
jgi:PAS domain-containing protein